MSRLNELLSRSGLPMDQAHTEVLSVFLRHPSADFTVHQVFEQVQERNFRADIVTVYRVVNELHAARLVQHQAPPGAPAGARKKYAMAVTLAPTHLFS